MNIDKLHTKAGSKNVIEVHGVLPTKDQLEDEYFPFEYNGIVLYGDMAPKYTDAYRLVKKLEYGTSYFVIVGTSFYTGISQQLMKLAQQRHAKIIIINDNASIKVPELCERLRSKLNQPCDNCLNDNDADIEMPLPSDNVAWDIP
jgi:NAD-dependent SIR2 family protein deacetylase